MRLLFATLAMAILFSGCAVKQRQMDLQDGTISGHQAEAKKACYSALKGSRPDMSGWSADKIATYTAIERLGQANLIIAGKSIDPCADAGGTNVYDAEIAYSKADADVKKAQSGFFKDVLNKGLIALGIWKVADVIEGGGLGGSQVNITGEGNTGSSSITHTSSEEWAGGGIGEGATGGATGGGGTFTDPLATAPTDTRLATEGVTFAEE